MALTQLQARAPRLTPQSRKTVKPVAILNFFKLPTGGSQASMNQRTQLKQELLEYLAPLDRGAAASEKEKAEVDRLASQLEKLNPNPKSLAAPCLSGKWRLLYTTSASILATSRPPFLRPRGPIYQTIDAEKLKARNNESGPFYNQVTAELTPLDAKKVAVQFKEFRILGLIPIQAPPSARGELAITYVDDDLRISRGDKGNLFVLDMADSSARL